MTKVGKHHEKNFEFLNVTFFSLAINVLELFFANDKYLLFNSGLRVDQQK